MSERKTYGQFCGLARTLDHIGDRWALLIVRELMGGPRPFRDLQESLDGISPNLLIDRLRSMTADGLVARNEAAARSKAVTYTLTDAGQALEPALLALIRWGTRWMVSGPGTDKVEPQWTSLALKALLSTGSTTERGDGVVHLNVDGTVVTIRLIDGDRNVLAGEHDVPDATVSGSMPDVLAFCSGVRRWQDLALDVSGDTTLVDAMLVTAPRT